jgi:hypothetical protein
MILKPPVCKRRQTGGALDVKPVSLIWRILLKEAIIVALKRAI